MARFLGLALGFTYWILMGRVGTPDMVGKASTVITIINLVVVLTDLGVIKGLPSFLGRCVGNSDYSSFKIYVQTAISILALSSLFAGTGIVILGTLVGLNLGFSHIMTISVTITLALSVIDPVLTTGLVSLLRTDYFALVTVIGGVTKIFIGLFLFSSGFGALGIVLGFTFMHLVLLVMSAISLRYILPETKDANRGGIQFGKDESREILTAGLPGYVSGIVNALGTQLAVLIMFGSVGGEQTGIYFMSWSLYGAAAIAPIAIMTLLLPYMSANIARDAQILKSSTKYSLLISFSLVFLMLLYPFVPLGLLGGDYAQESLILQIFALSIVPVTVGTAVTKLGYARENYKLVLVMGISANLPRIILYFLLIPKLGGLGAVLAFLTGSIIGCLAAVVAALRFKMVIGLIVLLKMFFSPLIITIFLYITGLHWVIGSVLLISLSGISYAKMGVVSREEAIGIVGAILPKKIREKIGPYLMRAIQLIYGE